MDWAQFCDKARELRRAADEAEEAFLSFLYTNEKNTEMWKGTGMTYPEALERANLCKAVRYLAYKRVLEGLGPKTIEGVGVHAVIAAGALKSPDEQREVIDRTRVWEKTNGTKISGQSAKRMVQDVKMINLGRKRMRGYAEIVAENERLREQNRDLTQQVATLRAELKALRSPRKATPARRASA